METGYQPDGWLGFILGSKLFFDFGGRYPFEVKLEGLVKEIRSKTGGAVPSTVNVTKASNSQVLKNI